MYSPLLMQNHFLTARNIGYIELSVSDAIVMKLFDCCERCVYKKT